MKKKKKQLPGAQGTPKVDAELLRMYLMGATNPGFSNKIDRADDVVDLHLNPSQVGKNKIPPQDALFHQLEQCEQALDKAIAAGKLEFRIVHGYGKGKLKDEVHKMLARHPHVRSFQNDYHSRYGHGSTIVYFK